MKRFLKQILGFGSLILLSILFVYSLADGTTDAFYLKFSSPKQSSLIIGSSRAAQGIRPQILDSILDDVHFYNYAFTITHAPYGEAYYKSVQKKLARNMTSGHFVLEVSPWALSERLTSEGTVNYWGQQTAVAKTSMVDLPINVEYLVESYEERNAFIIRNKTRKGQYHTFFVHDDGWLEVSIESDMFSLQERAVNKINLYRDRLPSYTGLSDYRLAYLEQTISFLKDYGTVYLLRMPVVDGMLDVEDVLAQSFDNTMEEISKRYGVSYINMMPENSNYHYTDGQHLTVGDSETFSIALAHKIDNINHP